MPTLDEKMPKKKMTAKETQQVTFKVGDVVRLNEEGRRYYSVCSGNRWQDVERVVTRVRPWSLGDNKQIVYTEGISAGYAFKSSCLQLVRRATADVPQQPAAEPTCAACGAQGAQECPTAFRFDGHLLCGTCWFLDARIIRADIARRAAATAPADAPLRVGDRVHRPRWIEGPGTVTAIAFGDVDGLPARVTGGGLVGIRWDNAAMNNSQQEAPYYFLRSVRRIDPPTAEPQQSEPVAAPEPQLCAQCGADTADPYHKGTACMERSLERAYAAAGVGGDSLDERIAAAQPTDDWAERMRRRYGRHAPQLIDPEEV